MKLFKNLKLHIISIVFLGQLAASSTTWAETVVIVNPSVSESSMTAQQVKALFLAKTKKLSGVKAKPVDQQEGKSIRSAFVKKVLGKTEDQLKAYWARLAFSGKAVPPKLLSNDDAIKAFVASTPGGIGFIDKKNVDDSVKVVFTVL